MTQEDKKLLIQDLCARLPYNVKACESPDYPLITINAFDGDRFVDDDGWEHEVGTFKPYLRPMSSMTEEEKRHVSKMICLKTYDNGVVYDIPYDVYTPYYVMEDCLNYLRSIHVDYSGLIEKGLAINCTNLNIY